MDLWSYNRCYMVLVCFTVVTLVHGHRHLIRDNPCSAHEDLVHITARGDDDTLHYVYSSRGVPSVMVARASRTSKLYCNCTAFYSDLPRSISVTPQPDAAFVLLFTQLIEYEDRDDAANLQHYKSQNSTWFGVYDLSSAGWGDVEVDNLSHIVTFTANNHSQTDVPFLANGSFNLRFHMFENEGYDDKLPHLSYSENVSHIDVILDQLNAHSNKSRFAIELVLITSNNIGHDMALTQQRTVDDEHSPGSFHSIDWVTDSSDLLHGAFLSWKPVCYIADDRKVATSQRTMTYDLQPYTFLQESANSSGLAFAYFGWMNVTSMTHVRADNVSFGGPKDVQFYNKTQHVEWAFAVGFGAPISDSFSLVVIIVVAVGLGIPLLVIVIGSAYIVYKRLCSRYRGYVEISSSYAEIN